MQNELKEEILRLCRRRARLEEAKVRQRKHIVDKLSKRSGKKFVLNITKKSHVHVHFSPAYCARNASFLARSIWHSIQNKEYKPLPAIRHRIKKLDGGHRNVMQFSIPDAALSNIVLKKVTARNLKRFSSNSYAYRRDRNLFDAVLALRSSMQSKQIYMIRIDFKNYFDSISTDFLREIISNKNIISITRHERFIIRQFLNHEFKFQDEYDSGSTKKRSKGTPQGLSLSGLLANLGCHELDLALERKAGRFVRYADDIVALCSSFAEAEEIEATIHTYCARSGISVNESKSSKITVIRKNLPIRDTSYADVNRNTDQTKTIQQNDRYHNSIALRAQTGFDYLGYRFSTDGLSIPAVKLKKIEQDFSRLIHLQLIHYIRNKKGFNKKRCNIKPHRFDWDILGMIGSLRAYLYGGLDEVDVRAFVESGKKLSKMKGLMGFYALIDAEDQLLYLDKRLRSCVIKATTERFRILKSDYNWEGLRPTIKELLDGTWMDKKAWKTFDNSDTTELIDLRLPSFVRGWRAARKHYFTYGLDEVQPPSYQYELST